MFSPPTRCVSAKNPEVLDQAGLDLAHVAVIDGVFWPMTTAGPRLVRALPDRFIKDVHLMIVEPFETALACVNAGRNRDVPCRVDTAATPRRAEPRGKRSSAVWRSTLVRRSQLSSRCWTNWNCSTSSL